MKQVGIIATCKICINYTPRYEICAPTAGHTELYSLAQHFVDHFMTQRGKKLEIICLQSYLAKTPAVWIQLYAWYSHDHDEYRTLGILLTTKEEHTHG